jgi:hypothetical protein
MEHWWLAPRPALSDSIEKFFEPMLGDAKDRFSAALPKTVLGAQYPQNVTCKYRNCEPIHTAGQEV